MHRIRFKESPRVGHLWSLCVIMRSFPRAPLSKKSRAFERPLHAAQTDGYSLFRKFVVNDLRAPETNEPLPHDCFHRISRQRVRLRLRTRAFSRYIAVPIYLCFLSPFADCPRRHAVVPRCRAYAASSRHVDRVAAYARQMGVCCVSHMPLV